MAELPLSKHTNIPFRADVTMIWWAQTQGIFLIIFHTWISLSTGCRHITFKLQLVWIVSICQCNFFPTSSINISVWKHEYGIILYMVGICTDEQIICMHVWNKCLSPPIKLRTRFWFIKIYVRVASWRYLSFVVVSSNAFKYIFLVNQHVPYTIIYKPCCQLHVICIK